MSAFMKTSSSLGFPRAVLLAGTGLLLVACASEPMAVPAPPAATVAPLPDTRVYVYPAEGQSAAQLDRDRYECHLWAVRQSGFDPSVAQAAPHQRVEVVAMPPPGSDAAAGAATGAILGAVVSRPREAAGQALIGAGAGGGPGAASPSARAQPGPGHPRPNCAPHRTQEYPRRPKARGYPPPL